MVELFRRSAAILFAGVLGFAGTASAQPSPTSAPGGDPPARVGRLAFVQGTVSFHDRDQTDWAPAVVNTPLTSGDALWTEPNARSEVSIAGTRVRMDSGTQLDMLAIDDTQTRMQIDQGRLDIKTFSYDTHQPYEILTPRGTITLQQQGDYYVEAGSTQDPTRLGVRQGAAQIQAPNGQVLAVRAGEVGEVSDDNGSPQLRTIPSAPPPMPAYWAERDRTVVYDQPPQYVTANMTGYEDLNGYGSWSNDPDYGEVWTPRAVVAGWEPYRTGRWSYVQPWGWTWVDEQPWGFAPYHYGRWANRNNHWVWVPPQRDLRPVYAPALVAFVGGVELGVAVGQQSRAPVGWFPLGPREVYVPPYSNDRDYYRRINQSARVQDQVMETRWQQAQRHEAIAANQQQTAFMNRRFATVVPAEDFARSRPVARVALQVAPDKLTAAPVAPVAAPPSPTQSIRAVQAPGSAAPATAPGTAPATAPNARPQAQGQAAAPVNVPTTQTRFANMQAIGRPEPTTAAKAPGPQIATTRSTAPTAAPSATAPSATAPNASAPTASAPNAAPSVAHPGLPPLVPRTGAPPPQLQGERTPAPGQPGTPPKPADSRAVTTPPTGGQPPASQPGQPPRPPAQANRPVEPPKPGEPPKPQQAQQPAPPTQAAPPKPQGAVTPPAPQPQPQATPPKPQPQQAQQPVAPPPQHQPAPPSQPQAEPPKPQGAVTPPPQPQHLAAPPPPAQAHAPAPPPPAQAHAPAPAPQPQPQAHPAPQQQAQAPAPAPQQHAAPPPPPQHPAPQPAPPKKDDEKK